MTAPTATAQAGQTWTSSWFRDAVVVPEVVDDQANIEGRNVAAVDPLWDNGTWGLGYTSLK